MLNEKMGNRIHTIRKRLNMDQWSFAKKLNMQPKSIVEWENGNYAPTTDEINKLYKAFSVPTSYILEGIPDNIMPVDNSSKIKIPILNNDLSLNKIEGYIETFKDNLPDGDLFWFKCIDDAMKPKIKKNDYVLVHRQDDANDKDVVIADTDGIFEIYNLHKIPDQNVFIRENSCEEYPPNTTLFQEIKIVGKVIQRTAYF